jgi:hypothetical protein
MTILDVLLCVPAEVVAANLFPLLAGRELVRLDSASLSHRARQVLTVVFAMSHCFRHEPSCLATNNYKRCGTHCVGLVLEAVHVC